MNYAEIKRLVKLVETSGIGELEVEIEGSRVRIAKPQPPQFVSTAALTPLAQAEMAARMQPPAESLPPKATPPPPTPPVKTSVDVTSPMVGTFYRAPSPEAPPYVSVGDRVKPGSALCIIEAMKLMNEIEAEVAGRVTEIAVENAKPVEFGQLMIRIEPD
ncbi:MAG: acetyl-CoA carboxylase biotin carboxyl carrier protein [Calditrichota bacterium]